MKIARLGRHILINADCRHEEAVKAGAEKIGKIRAIITDPPYGINYEESVKFKPGNHVINTMNNDEIQTDEEYAKFTKEWLNACKGYLDKYNASYIFTSDLMMCALRQGMKQAGFYYSQMIIWIKNTIVVGRKDYLPQHKLIAYGWHGRHKMERSKDRSVMFYPKPHRSKLHPTMKPVGLIRKLVMNSTKMDEVVYDPFGGSGTTLIACEHTKRKCLMIESEEQYFNIIIKRWEKLTGKKGEIL